MDNHRCGVFWAIKGEDMSVWYEIQTQEDVDVSLDGKFLNVLFSTDDAGNNYVEIPIKFILHCLHGKASQPNAKVEV